MRWAERRFDAAVRRLAALATALGVVLAGCGGGPGHDVRTATAATRMVQDLRGPVEVPADPQRVAILWSRALPELVTELRVPVVGATTDAGTLSPLIDADTAAGITNLGETAEPNLEQVAAANPDLILAFDLTVNGAVLERYRAIAPVFVLDGTNLFNTPWRDLVRTVARAVNREATAEQLITGLEARIAELRPRLAELYAGQTVGVAAAFGLDQAGLVSAKHPVGAVLDELGLDRPAEHEITEPALVLSPEEIKRVDADHLFYFFWGYQGEPSALTQNPLWPTLRAVSSGQAHPVDGQLWTVPVPAAIHVVLDDVEHTLLGG